MLCVTAYVLQLMLCTFCRWAVLDVGVSGPVSGYDDQTLLKAAGYLEGVMTHQCEWRHTAHTADALPHPSSSPHPLLPVTCCRLIYLTYQNLYGLFFNKAKPEVVEKARTWYLEQVCTHPLVSTSSHHF